MIRYIGFFHDRDRRPFGDTFTEGEAFLSLEEAKAKLRERLRSNLPCGVAAPVMDDEAEFVSRQRWEPITELFPAVTEDAFIDLYAVVRAESHSEWGRVAPEPDVRLSFGPRFGARTDNF